MSEIAEDYIKHYKHLTENDRYKIEFLLFWAATQIMIAAAIGCAQSTISREIRRNRPFKNNVKYKHKAAQRRADQRKWNAAKKELLKDPVIRKYVHEKIKAGWSPEQIAGRLPIDHPGLKTNYESIYLYIYKVATDLIKCLPKRHRKRNKRGLKKETRVGKIPFRNSIDERPEIVNMRGRIGDWEIDTIVSRKSKFCLQVMIERYTR